VKLTPKPPANIYELGGRTGALRLTYSDLIALLGRPNANPKGEEKDGKIKARWFFRNADKPDEYICVWSYKYSQAKYCTEWSCGGTPRLFQELFGVKYTLEVTRNFC
jgi:hypothetical protein